MPWLFDLLNVKEWRKLIFFFINNSNLSMQASQFCDKIFYIFNCLTTWFIEKYNIDIIFCKVWLCVVTQVTLFGAQLLETASNWEVASPLIK